MDQNTQVETGKVEINDLELIVFVVSLCEAYLIHVQFHITKSFYGHVSLQYS